jgi:alkylhydroperoxidase family enzyme
MTFIEAVGEPNYQAAFTTRPDVYEAWQHLVGTIRTGLDPRRYELATMAAARRMRSSYCMLAHGSVLMEKYMPAEELRAIVADHRAAGLDEDGVGAQPDATYAAMDPALRDALVVGRPIAQDGSGGGSPEESLASGR